MFYFCFLDTPLKFLLDFYFFSSNTFTLELKISTFPISI